MLKKHYSLEHADKILEKLFQILGRSDEDSSIVVKCWSNGREQGYMLEQWSLKSSVRICFAQ